MHYNVHTVQSQAWRAWVWHGQKSGLICARHWIVRLRHFLPTGTVLAHCLPKATLMKQIEGMTWHDFDPTSSSMPLVLDTWWRLCLTCHGLDLLKNLGMALSRQSEKAQCYCQWLILLRSAESFEQNASPLGGGGSSSKFGTVYLGWEGRVRGMTSGETHCTCSWCLDQKWVVWTQLGSKRFGLEHHLLDWVILNLAGCIPQASLQERCNWSVKAQTVIRWSPVDMVYQRFFSTDQIRRLRM